MFPLNLSHVTSGKEPTANCWKASPNYYQSYLGVHQKTILPPRKPFIDVLPVSLSVKMSSSSDKTAATAASAFYLSSTATYFFFCFLLWSSFCGIFFFCVTSHLRVKKKKKKIRKEACQLYLFINICGAGCSPPLISAACILLQAYHTHTNSMLPRTLPQQ